MKIYLSGKMSGLPEHGFPLFNSEAARLRALGYDVVNPAELKEEPGWNWLDFMIRDLEAMKDVEAIALLDNWWDSDGAHMEHIVAQRMGYKVYMARELKEPLLEFPRVALP
jgi:hypothetical protein